MPKMMGGMMPKMMRGIPDHMSPPKNMMGGMTGNNNGGTPSTPMPSATTLGDRLLRTFLVFKNQPLTQSDAVSQGFVQFTSGCTQFGYGYGKSSGGPSKGDSAILYFSAGGQLAGFGSRMWGSAPAALIQQGYWMATNVGDGSYDLILTTRDPATICTGATDTANVVGDRLLINGQMSIPLVMSAAQQAGWVEGNCINKMGVHHAYDLNAPSQQTWNASSLVPVLPMYNPVSGHITAVLLASTDAQRVEPFGDWEGPFINALMCKNWCANTGCTFPGVTFWTTMHWLFEDPTLNVCTGARCVL